MIRIYNNIYILTSFVLNTINIINRFGHAKTICTVKLIHGYSI